MKHYISLFYEIFLNFRFQCRHHQVVHRLVNQVLDNSLRKWTQVIVTGNHNLGRWMGKVLDFMRIVTPGNDINDNK